MGGMTSGGSLVEGFHSLEVLRRSARATVYRAVPDGGGAPVVLKVARAAGGGPERPPVPDGVPGAVRVLASGSTRSGRPFTAMPLYGEGDYAALLEGRHPLPAAEVAGVGAALAATLSALRAAGLAHPAVEPSHVLRGEEGVALAGLDRVLPADAPAPVPEAAELHYSPPEAVGGGVSVPASDVYRLAATLWALLAGRPPFSDGDGALFALRERVRGEVLPPPRADLPDSWQEVLARGLEKDPGLRHPDVSAFAADLEAAVSAPAAVAAATVPVPGPPAAPTAGRAPVTGPSGERAEPPAAPEPPSAPVGGRTPRVEHAARAASPPGPAEPAVDGPPRPGASAERTGAASAGRREAPGASPPLAAREAGPPRDPWHGIVDREDTVSIPARAPSEPGGDAPRDPWHGLVGRRDPEPPAQPPRHGPGLRPPTAVAPSGSEGAASRWGAVRIAVAAASVLVIVLGVATFLNPGPVAAVLAAMGIVSPGPSAPEAGPPEAGEVPGAAIDPEAAPTDVVLEDSGDSVLLAWTAAEGAGGVPHHVVGGPAGETPASLADAPAGTDRARVQGLDPEAEYCFIVIAVLGGDTIAHSEEVCTERSGG